MPKAYNLGVNIIDISIMRGNIQNTKHQDLETKII